MNFILQKAEIRQKLFRININAKSNYRDFCALRQK